MFAPVRFGADWHVVDDRGRTVRRFGGAQKNHGPGKSAKRNAAVYAALLNAVGARAVQSRDGFYAVWDQPDERGK